MTAIPGTMDGVCFEDQSSAATTTQNNMDALGEKEKDVGVSHVGEGEEEDKEDDDMLVSDSDFEEIIKQFSLRLQAVHNIPQNSSMLSSAKSSRFLKLKPNVSNDWLH